MMAGLKQKSETASKIEIYHKKKTDSEVFKPNKLRHTNVSEQ